MRPFTVPKGAPIVVDGETRLASTDMRVVPVTVVRDRDETVANYIVRDAAGAWHGCRTVVRYDDAWFAGMAGGHSDNSSTKERSRNGTVD